MECRDKDEERLKEASAEILKLRQENVMLKEILENVSETKLVIIVHFVIWSLFNAYPKLNALNPFIYFCSLFIYLLDMYQHYYNYIYIYIYIYMCVCVCVSVTGF